MDLKVAYDSLNFWINKKLGSFYSPDELDKLVDNGQISYFTDIQPMYATSQRVKDTLSPFRDKYTFTTGDTFGGVMTIPTNRDFMDFLDMYITYAISGRTVPKQVPIQLYNEDTRAFRLDSQIDPVTVTSPIGEMIGLGSVQIYPETTYNGAVTFLRRPVAPFFSYTVISGRVIVYDAGTSVQLEWRDSDIQPLLLKCLNSIGINLSDNEIAQWAEMKTQQNFVNQNKT